MPPPPVLITVATRSRRSGSQLAMSASPACSMASVAAAMANCTKRLMRRAIFMSMVRRGSKPFTSAAMRTSFGEASKWVIGPAPERPVIRPPQYSAALLPIGVIAP